MTRVAHPGRSRDRVVGIMRQSGELLYNPSGDTVAEPESVLIALGQRRHLDQLEKLASSG
jgi:Trk K+ transport system NAD-binding subunit